VIFGARTATFVLHRMEYAPGVYVSGRISPLSLHVTGTLHVDAPGGLGGTLDFRRGRITGTLGGRRVSTSIPWFLNSVAA
jgi:hypothetical protein